MLRPTTKRRPAGLGDGAGVGDRADPDLVGEPVNVEPSALKANSAVGMAVDFGGSACPDPAFSGLVEVGVEET